MFNSISGRLTFKSPDLVGIDTGGVEWAIECTTSTIADLPSINSDVKVFTYLHHNQDTMKMFGFGTTGERNLFLLLLTVNGVGTSLARKILSSTRPEQFLVALDAQDLESLQAIPGLGTKTAQKIILQLRGKISMPEDEGHKAPSELKDVVMSLVAMGFDSRQAEKSVSVLLNEVEINSLTGGERDKELLRRAIICLSKR